MIIIINIIAYLENFIHIMFKYEEKIIFVVIDRGNPLNVRIRLIVLDTDHFLRKRA